MGEAGKQLTYLEIPDCGDLFPSDVVLRNCGSCILGGLRLPGPPFLCDVALGAIGVNVFGGAEFDWWWSIAGRPGGGNATVVIAV